MAISLYAKGLTTGEISAHFQEVYGASVSKDTVSRITDRVIEDMQAWCSRPLLAVYAAVVIDAIYVKVRDASLVRGNRVENGDGPSSRRGEAGAARAAFRRMVDLRR